MNFPQFGLCRIKSIMYTAPTLTEMITIAFKLYGAPTEFQQMCEY